MGAGAGGAAEEHGVVALQALGHVIGVEDGLLGGLRGGHGGEHAGAVAVSEPAAEVWARWPAGLPVHRHQPARPPAALKTLNTAAAAAAAPTLVSPSEPIMEM